jgi:hypothetical protein
VSIATYDIGDLPRLTTTFKVGGVLTDPSAITFAVKRPDDTLTTYTYGVGGQIVKDSVGTYHVDLSLDQRGLWHYRWTGTGSAEGAEEGRFYVRQRQTA